MAIALTPVPGGSGVSGGVSGGASDGGERHPDARPAPTCSTPRSGVHHTRDEVLGIASKAGRRGAAGGVESTADFMERTGGEGGGGGEASGVVYGAGGVQRVEVIPQLIGAIKLLSNLLAGCGEAKLACVSLQLPLLMLRVWPLTASSAHLKTQLLTLLCTYVAHCAAAKASLSVYSDSKGRCLATLVVRMLTRPTRASQPPLPEAHWRVGWAALRSLATAPESRASLVRNHLIPKAVALLQRNLGATDESRAAPILDFFANLTFEPEGQTALLKEAEAFNAVLEGLESKLPDARNAAALCIRNLCFAADGRTAVLSRPRALPALLRALHPADVVLAARAAAALWSLIGRCERAKAVLRGAALQGQLRAAERALTAKAMVAPPDAANERELLGECLRCMGAVMSILRL